LPITSPQNPVSKKKIKRPLLWWIISRLEILPGKLVVATTTDVADNEIEQLVKKNFPLVDVFRGHPHNVIHRMNKVVRANECDFVFRALGDCPFLATELVSYATNKMDKEWKHAFVWYLSPETLPVYGAREFPYSSTGWNKITMLSAIKGEHVDTFFHENRRRFDILFHLPPHNDYFRNYRLEIDYLEDYEMLQALGKEISLLSPLKTIIKFLDENPSIAAINSSMTEKTGPFNLSTYSNKQRRIWHNHMVGKPYYTWDGKKIAPADKAKPIFCNCGTLLGQGLNGKLYLAENGSVMEKGYPRCTSCSLMSREWKR
jgi:spore coat polysaccharide biosynthesis protein SpsF (cytidylyltransferase family)